MPPRSRAHGESRPPEEQGVVRTAMTEAKGLSRTAKIALALVALGATCVPCIGVSAAIAMPAYIQYARRARTAEALANLAMLESMVGALGQLPPTTPPTPSIESLSEERRMWPADAHPGWMVIGFSPADPVYYSYSVTSDPTALSVRIEAVGDLNGNGRRSSFSRTGQFDPALGEVRWGELVVLDELE